MDLLYSNILPLSIEEGQETFQNCFEKQISNSDRVEIATGYVSKTALEELDRIISNEGISYISLTIGMYYVEGMPEGTYHTALSLHNKWVENGTGEIRIVKSFKYHGKLYAFYNKNQVHTAIIGSANLGAIKLDASNRRQYEVSAITADPTECNEIASFIRKVASH